MRDASAIKPIQLTDYLPPAFLVESTHLDVTLDANRTRIISRLQLTPNPKRDDKPTDCWLDGEQLELVSVAIDGEPLPPNRYQQNDKGLLIRDLTGQCLLTIEVYNSPQANTALEGLYMSHGMFCTQCEAQGFRRITFYPDRPDVLATFTTTVRGNKAEYPLLLSNGNPVAKGDDGDTHWVTWEDPFPKPSYLFALVAGDLACLEDSFTTNSGREVSLKIFAEEQDLDKLDHAMISLKNAMAWDEKNYGREYDLDLFMIVAVSHFNMGAMENKGLNVFNTSCVLAHPKTTTDAGFQRVESVVAHEYFHNWSGNRVTCRDWFQLSLKEGFTVFREHEFASDMNSRAVKRVEDVSLLRSHQFPEDQGPMAHPVRPASYQKVDNFYTLTIYEKGSEIVRMQADLLGRDKFRQATDDYFNRFDGQAVTCDDFVACIERAGNTDLSQFKRWYSQAGTPHISASSQYRNGLFTLTLKQHNAATPGQNDKQPQVIPVKMALVGNNKLLPLNDNGNVEQVLLLDSSDKTFTFTVDEPPVPSLLRGFSAPVTLDYDYSENDLARLLTHDTDGFCRWDAAQRLYIATIERLINNPASLTNEAGKLTALFRQLLVQQQTDPAELALLLTLPAETLVGDRQPVWQPETVHNACLSLQHALASALEDNFWQLVDRHATPGDYRPLADDIGKRSLRWCALSYLATLGSEKVTTYLLQTFEQANNMTDELSALRLLVHNQLNGADQVLKRFEERWQNEALVMDKWFAIQASRPADSTLDDVRQLLTHPRFELTSPNRVRALLSSFAGGNPVAFHQPSGDGYQLYFDQIAALDKINPQVAARMATVASRLARLPESRRNQLQSKLQQLISGGVSDNLTEVLQRIIGSSH